MTTPATEHYSSTTRESSIRQIWRFRRLLLTFVKRDLKVKYQRSALGLLWSFLSPLLLVLVLVLVFNSVLRISSDGFWAFLISGIFVWQFISGAIGRATSVLRGHGAVRRSVSFPTVIVVLSTLLALLIEFLIEIVIVMAALFIFYHSAVPMTVLLLPWLIVLLFLMAAGLMLPLSVVSVLFYDVEHIMPAILRLLFFLTPIFYPVSMIPEHLRAYFYLSPFVGMLELFHLTLYEGVWPSWELLGAMSAASIAMFLGGFWIFQRFEDTCVEIA
jgi:ABC-type polysaccharide/polyol phosphate export permease